MTYEDFVKGLKDEPLHYAENLQVQRDDAIARIADYDAKAADTAKAQQDALAAKDKDKQDALDALTAKHASEMTAKDADWQSKLDATVTPLRQQIATLTAQIAGAKGKYQIVTSSLQDAGLALESSEPASWVRDNVTALLDGIAVKHQNKILELALSKYPSLPKDARQAILGALGFVPLAGLDVAEQLPILAAMGLARFLALPVEVRGKVIELIGI